MDLFTALVTDLQDPAAGRLTAGEVEELLAGRGREVLRQMVQDHLDLRAVREQEAARERGRAVMGADGITRSRVETGHRRLLATLFGTVGVTRCAWRRPGAGNLYPADAALSLPAPRHSHTLARLAALEAARGSFETAHAAITSRCGPVIGKRQIEQAVVAAAADIAAFYATRIPVPCTAPALLVISADAKGVVMRPGALRPATAKAAARQARMRTRLSAGEKPNRKRMATLACVYDAEPAPRRPHDVIAPPGGRHGHRTLRPRPKARAKWLAGSVEHDPAEVIAAAFDQAEARDPARRRTWVVLVDGAEHQLDLIRAEAARRGITISIVIDLCRAGNYADCRVRSCQNALRGRASRAGIPSCGRHSCTGGSRLSFNRARCPAEGAGDDRAHEGAGAVGGTRRRFPVGVGPPGLHAVVAGVQARRGRTPERLAREAGAGCEGHLLGSADGVHGRSGGAVEARGDAGGHETTAELASRPGLVRGRSAAAGTRAAR